VKARTTAAIALTSFVLFLAACGSTDFDAPSPTGVVGAAHFDERYLQVGSGETTVDLFFDPLCESCADFDLANGDALQELVDVGEISLRLHTLALLDRASEGTEYSTRASAALICQATINEPHTFSYLRLLFDNQPLEGDPGLTDARLVALAGPSDISDCVAAGAYQSWVQENTTRAITSPNAIEGLPTVRVNGADYTGPITAQAINEFAGANP
jgi:protein-disulfide isomerase